MREIDLARLAAAVAMFLLWMLIWRRLRRMDSVEEARWKRFEQWRRAEVRDRAAEACGSYGKYVRDGNPSSSAKAPEDREVIRDRVAVEREFSLTTREGL